MNLNGTFLRRVCVAALALVGAPASAQETAGLRAFVLDEAEQVIKAVSIQLVDGASRSWLAGANEAGRIEFEGLPPGVPLAATILVSGIEWAPRAHTVTLEAGEIHEVQWSVHLRAAVTGVAIDANGATQAGAWLQIARASGNEAVFEDSGVVRERVAIQQSGPSGEFVFHGVLPGRYCIGPVGELPPDQKFELVVGKDGKEKRVRRRDPKTDVCPLLVPIEVRPNEPELLVDVTLHRAPTIAGVVRGPKGTRIKNVTLLASKVGVSNSLIATTDQRGRFSFGPLAEGEYTITGKLFGPGGWVYQGAQAAKPGETDLLLVGAPTGELQGKVALHGSGNLSGLLFVISGVGTARERTELLWSVAGPAPLEFGTDRLPQGRYRLIYAGNDGLRYGQTEFEVTSDRLEVYDVELPVVLGAQMDIVHGWPGATAEVRVLQDGKLVMEAWPEEGETRRMAVPTGKLRVVVSVDGGRHERVFEVVAVKGEACEVVLTK